MLSIDPLPQCGQRGEALLDRVGGIIHTLGMIATCHALVSHSKKVKKKTQYEDKIRCVAFDE